MRSRSGAVLFCSLALMLAACAGDDGATDPPTANMDNKPPYGPGVEIGKSYDYMLYTHCGIEWARIDGFWWHTTPINDGNSNPPLGWDNPYDTGELVVIDHFTAVYNSGRDINVEFKRTIEVNAPFVCQ